jgi:hypothetical protein
MRHIGWVVHCLPFTVRRSQFSDRLLAFSVQRSQFGVETELLAADGTAIKEASDCARELRTANAMLVRHVGVCHRSGHGIALTEFSFEQLESHTVNDTGSGSIISRTFISHKRVSTIELVPAENAIRIG